jgi:hypothetical protein
LFGSTGEGSRNKLTVKYDGRTVPNPDHITLSSNGRVARVEVRNGKFNVPAEISRAKTWRLAALVIGERIQISGYRSDLAYENWTVHVANRHYNEDYAFAVPKGADIRSSCILVLESEHVDPGTVIFQSHCRSRD